MTFSDEELFIPDLYNICTAVLGKRKDCMAFQQLRKALQEEPTSNISLSMSSYCFEKHGIILIYDEDNGYFQLIVFLVINSPEVRNGHIDPYRGSFLADVTPTDLRSQAERKIGFAPTSYMSHGSYWDGYDFPDHKVQFIFDGVTEQIRQVGVVYKPPEEA